MQIREMIPNSSQGPCALKRSAGAATPGRLDLKGFNRFGADAVKHLDTNY